MNGKALSVSRALRAACAALAAFVVVFGPVAAGQETGGAQPRAGGVNVILFINDGWGFPHADAASIYKYGQTGGLVYQRFPVALAASTYPAGGSYDGQMVWSDFDHVKKGATDSAAGATALATGCKTYSGAIGVTGTRENATPVRNVVEAAEALGKSTGVVSTVQFSHATPAGFVAHNAARGNYAEIAEEMLTKSAVDVIIGCGHPWYDENGHRREKPEAMRFVGDAEGWATLQTGAVCADCDGDGEGDGWTLVERRDEFQRLASGDTPKRLCGVVQVESTNQAGREGESDAPFSVAFTETVPTLAEMTRAAINVLDEDPDGFFLMVEGGAVDWAAHENNSARVVEEQLDLEDAVQAAIDWVEANSSWDKTLIIVTADHETGYLTGPGSGPGENGAPPVWNAIENRGKGVLPGMEWHSGSHTNSLVPLYAKGAGADILERFADENDPIRGAYVDNTEIAKTIFEAMGASVP